MATQHDVLEIRLFGGLTMHVDGEQLPPLPSRHARLLLAWLAMNAGRPQPRAVLADMLWPDLPEARARRRLSHALWQVQDCIGEVAANRQHVVSTGDMVVFDRDAPYELDVEEFERRLDEVDQAQALDGPALRQLRRCVELYRGDLLAGAYETWVLTEQERLRQRHETSLGHLVEGCKQRGNFDEALSFARRLTHQAPLREDAHREVMRLCVLLGQPSAALEQFERCRSVLEEELGAEPSAATVRLRDQIQRSRAAGVSRPQPVEQLVSRRLVGRDEQRVTLVDQLERTLAGTVGMVFVEGEPGIGKTELLAQTAEDARWRGFTVLWGACAGTDVPYSAIGGALDAALDDVRVAQLRAHVEPVWLREAAQLLPALASPTDVGRGPMGAAPARARLDGADGARRMQEALARVVTALAAIEPVVLILEDAHRADEDTLALLQAVARTADGSRLLVVLSFRDVDARADEAVWAGLRAVDRDASPVRVRLEPLTPFETAALLREVLGTPQVPASFAAAVHREGGGNPLYVLELLRALRDEGALGPGQREHLDTLAVPVTDGLRAVIAGRLDHLDDASTTVVRLGAVLGIEFHVDTLQAAGELEPRELARALGELARRNLLDVRADTCRLTHAATRRVVLDGLDGDEAVRLHGVAADALEATHPDQVEALAAHMRAARRPRPAVRYLLLAADRATDLHAYSTAATHLAGADALADEADLTTAERFDLLLRLEFALDVLGRRDEQATVLASLRGHVDGDRARDVESQLRWSAHLGMVDRFAEATATARAAVQRAGEDDPVLRGRALTALGRVLGWAGDNDRAATVLEEAVALLGDEGEDVVRARFALGSALRFLQRFGPAEEALTAALRLAEERDDDVGVVHALGGLADLHAETGRTGPAVEAHDRAVAIARRIGLRHREGVSLVNLGTVRLTRGEPVPALVAYDGADEVFRSLGNRRGTAMVQLNRAWLRHRWLGRAEEAARDASAALAYFSEIGSSGLVAVCSETLAGIAREGGDTDGAGRWLDEGLAAARAGNDKRAEVQIQRGRVELLLVTGEAAAASTLAQRALRTATALGLEEFVADLASLAALAAVTAGLEDEVEAAVTTAVEHLGTSAEPHRVHQRLATIATATGRDAEARVHGLAAHQLLTTALASLDDRTREAAMGAIAEHREIADTGGALAPRSVSLRMARLDAPRGRALEADELVTVELELQPADGDPASRRSLLLQVLTTVQDHGAMATVGDLSTALDVSASTIRRDLRALRTQGHTVVTRGSGTG